MPGTGQPRRITVWCRDDLGQRFPIYIEPTDEGLVAVFRPLPGDEPGKHRVYLDPREALRFIHGMSEAADWAMGRWMK